MVTCAEAFTANLDSKEIRYTVCERENGGIIIQVPFSGKVTNVIFDGDDNGTHPALRTVFETCPSDRIADVLVVCNQMNQRFRWVKFYVDNDSDVMIEDDAIVTPENAGEELFELLIRTVNIMKDAKPSIMRAMFG